MFIHSSIIGLIMKKISVCCECYGSDFRFDEVRYELYCNTCGLVYAGAGAGVFPEKIDIHYNSNGIFTHDQRAFHNFDSRFIAVIEKIRNIILNDPENAQKGKFINYRVDKFYRHW